MNGEKGGIELENSVNTNEISPSARLAGVRDLSELQDTLNTIEELDDQMSGKVRISEEVKENVRLLSLDLGQAAGLIRQDGHFGESPKRIVDEVFAKSSNLPRALQSVFQRVATEYINNAIEGGEEAQGEETNTSTEDFNASEYEQSVIQSVHETLKEEKDPEDIKKIEELENQLGVSHGEGSAEFKEASIKNEMSPNERLAGVRDLSELQDTLNTIEELDDQMSGKVVVNERVRDLVQKLTLDLGQAVGLLKDTGVYGETSKRIYDQVSAESLSLPPVLQRTFNRLAYDYVTGAINEFGKK